MAHYIVSEARQRIYLRQGILSDPSRIAQYVDRYRRPDERVSWHERHIVWHTPQWLILTSTSCSSKFFGVNSNRFKAVGSSFEKDPYPVNLSGTVIDRTARLKTECLIAKKV
jgi:hypothetical protein